MKEMRGRRASAEMGEPGAQERQRTANSRITVS